jgi:hypothetical protein
VTAQVAVANVVAECACGCSSVRLSPSTTPRREPVHSEVGADGSGVRVVLHLLDGRLHELEVFDSDAGEACHRRPRRADRTPVR